MDPAEVRRINLLPAVRPSRTPRRSARPTTPATTPRRSTRCSRRPATPTCAPSRRAGGSAATSVQLGIGLSVYVEITGAGGESGAPQRERDASRCTPTASATILTGTSPHGQGHATAWAMLASEELGIPIDKITVLHGDTDLVPRGGGTGGSRSLQQGGAAVHQAAGELVELARERAAEQLEADPARPRRRPGTRRAGRARRAGHRRSASPSWPRTSSCWSQTTFSAAGADVPVRRARGRRRGRHRDRQGRGCVRLVAVDDAGTILNPLLAEGQRHGGLAQGVAQALLEEVLYDADGNPQTSTLADYPFVSATELPSFELVDMATPDAVQPARRQGHRRGRHDRLHPGGAERRRSTPSRTSASGTSTCRPPRSGCGGRSSEAAAGRRT